jgi:hypothetical protein
VLSRKANTEWALEGDIQGRFDNISQDWLIANIPVDKAILQKWLKAGYLYQNELLPTLLELLRIYSMGHRRQASGFWMHLNNGSSDSAMWLVAHHHKV